MTLAGVALLTLVSWLQAATPVDPDKDGPALADKIDELIAAAWKSKHVTPAAPSDDAEFLRRVYLDLVGRIPPIMEVSDFLADKSKDKRPQLVKRLQASEGYATRQAAVWRAVILGKSTNQQVSAFAAGFDSYLAGRFKERAGLDKIVREIIATQPQAGGAGFIFYQANDNKMENLAAATSRVFMGVKIECAQCHNHPFAKWTREQFWEFAAFYSGTETGQLTGKPAPVSIPGTDKTVTARFLDGTQPNLAPNVDRRELLAQWLTSKENPWFARAIANRVWESLLGTGLVEPVDDFNPDNDPSHPELLDELAKQLAQHDFDVTFLIRSIVLSKTYQLTSTLSDPSQKDARLFARMPIRGMSAEQLFDSLTEATGQPEEPATPPGQRKFNRAVQLQLARTEFLNRFPDQDRHTETQTSILQALYFMNGKVTADATTLENNANLKRIAEASQSVSREKRIAELYMITLSRKPTAEETKRFIEYLDKAAKDGNEKKAYCDILWVLLNSTEFFFNH
jgi:hypothetical protein